MNFSDVICEENFKRKFIALIVDDEPFNILSIKILLSKFLNC